MISSTTILVMAIVYKVSTSGNSMAKNGLSKDMIVSDHCYTEYFNVTCPVSNTVLIHKALFGRMKFPNRCISGDYGGSTCSSDVTDLVSGRCSKGRKGKKKAVDSIGWSHQNHCSIFGSDPELLMSKHKCSADLNSYLSVMYSCQKVHYSVTSPCKTIANRKYRLLTGNTAYMSTSGPCPWKIEVSPGQSIVIEAVRLNDDHKKSCTRMGTVSEPVLDPQAPTLDTTTLDSCTSNTFPMVYKSNTNLIYLTLVLSGAIFKYTVVGCSSIPAQAGRKVILDTQLQGSRTAKVFCSGKQVGALICDGVTWIGHLANCTTHTEIPDRIESLLFNHNQFPFGLLVVVAVGVSLGILLGALLLSISSHFIQRRRNRREQDNSDRTYAEGTLCRIPVVGCSRDRLTSAQDSRLRKTDDDIAAPFSPEQRNHHIYECPDFTNR